MILVMLVGAVTGAAIYLLISVLQARTVTGAAGLAALDAERHRGRREASLTADRRHADESLRARRVGAQIREALEARGFDLPSSVRSNLGMVGTSVEAFLAQCLLGAGLGFLLPILVFGMASAMGIVGPTVSIWVAIIGAVLGAVLPYVQLGRRAADRRRDFRHVVGSFLDLVAMNLAGGRGVPEALQSAANISDGWAMVRIRDTLEAARLQGSTPWAALGALGDELDVDELRDLASALALVAEDGAKVRDSLTARAESMRSRELSDAEGRAAARSQSMLVAQAFLAIGFLLFLIYPAVARVLGA